MRLSTILIPSIFMFASMSTAIPVERENTRVTRFNSPIDVKAGAYGKDAELYARGIRSLWKKTSGRNPMYKKPGKQSPYQRIPSIPYQPGPDDELPNHETASKDHPDMDQRPRQRTRMSDVFRILGHGASPFNMPFPPPFGYGGAHFGA